MIVCKFGGTSVASKNGAKKIKEIVQLKSGRKIIVVSALGKDDLFNYKITDKLFELYYALCENRPNKDIIDEIFFRYETLSRFLNITINWSKYKSNLIKIISEKKYTKDFIVSRGEYYSAILYSKFLNATFLDAKNYIKFNKQGKLNLYSTKKLLKRLNTSKKYVIGGYYGSKSNGEICVFDRGGSDTTGAVISSCLNAEIYENYTDVTGVFNKNPNLFINAKKLSILNYKTAIKMAKCGNEVVHSSAIKIMTESNGILLVKNTANPNVHGTIISSDQIDEEESLYICTNKIYLMCFKSISKKTLDYLYSHSNILYIINSKNNYYVLAKNLYVPQQQIKSLINFKYISACTYFFFFSNRDKFNKNYLKNLNKLNKLNKNFIKLKSFCSYINNFLLVVDDTIAQKAINIINHFK